VLQDTVRQRFPQSLEGTWGSERRMNRDSVKGAIPRDCLLTAEGVSGANASGFSDYIGVNVYRALWPDFATAVVWPEYADSCLEVEFMLAPHNFQRSAYRSNSIRVNAPHSPKRFIKSNTPIAGSASPSDGCGR